MRRHESTYFGCFGTFDKRASKLSSLVPRIVIFLLIADVCLWVSGPDEGNEPLPEIIAVISSASLEASLNSFNHKSKEDAITEKKNMNQALFRSSIIKT